jgi:hypothetical protein
MAPTNLAARDGMLRVLLYPIIFEANPLDAAGRVIAHIIPRNGVSTVPGDYLSAIEAGLASSDALSELLPQPHAESVIRAYLAEVGRRLRERRS